MEQAEGTIVIDAPLEDVMEVIEDYESYPEWAEVKRVEIRERGEGARATRWRSRSTCRCSARPRTSLRYQYAPGDAGDLVDEHRGPRGGPRDPRRVPAGRAGRGATHHGGLPTRRSSSARSCPGSSATEGAKRVIENALERLKRRVEMG